MTKTRKPIPTWVSVLCAASILFLAVMPFTVQAQSAHDEPKVKAAFLLRFVQYIEWPQAAVPPANTPLVIGIVGADAIAAELSQMTANRPGQDRPVSVRALKSGADLAGVHVLFLGRDEISRIAQYNSAARARSVLVVTESPGALEQGSMINFVIADRRVKFEIGLDAVEKAGLVVSSRLLALAMRVHKVHLSLGEAIALF